MARFVEENGVEYEGLGNSLTEVLESSKSIGDSLAFFGERSQGDGSSVETV